MSSPSAAATARTAAAIIATAGLALLVAACGGSHAGHVAQRGATATKSSTPGTTSAASTRQSEAVAFAHCMRSNGVPNWPDPNSSGVFDKSELTSQQLEAGSSKVQAAQGACSHLLPGGGSGPNPAQVQQMKAQGLRFSRCMRRHDVTNFPDPGTDGRVPDSFGSDQGSPKFKTANQACRQYRPPYIPSNAAYDAWARTHG